MNDVTLEAILSDENIRKAIEHFKVKKDTCGIDGIKLSELPEYWKINSDRIKRELFEASYEPGIVSKKEIVSAKGKRREIVIINSIDRLLQRAVMQIIAPHFEKAFSDSSMAYREGKGTLKAAETVANYIEDGKLWVAEIDVSNYFDSIKTDRLQKKISAIIQNVSVLNLINIFLKCKVENDGEIDIAQEGILQGSPLSPLLANLYLNDFDHILESNGISFIRYGDDINLYALTYEEANMYRDKAVDLLCDEGLSVNNAKGGIFLAKNRQCLGYELHEHKGKVRVNKAVSKNRQIYNKWQGSSIRRINQEYHIVNEGVLTKKDFTILFENEEGKHYLPSEAVNGLNIYSNITIMGTFLEYANKVGLKISFIDTKGEKIGSFIPQAVRKSYLTEVEQILLLKNDQEHLKLAKKLENANIFNLRAVLRYYARRGHGSLIEQTIDHLTCQLGKVNEAKDINSLMMCEAQARQKYYQCFNEILQGNEFEFSVRSRRPPLDALNAMISFGNTLLYQRIANMINMTSLDIRFGLVHNSAKRTESLNLDIADLFKPIIVDRTIFTLVNRKMINEKENFRELKDGGIYLNNKGKTVFIGEYEQKLRQKIKIGKLEKTYEELIKYEIKKIEDYFRKGVAYKPYKYVN